MLRCSMTGLPLNDPSQGIYDDGEWISWNWINRQIDQQHFRDQYPNADPKLAELFETLVQDAASHFAMTGRFLQIWGELGELYAEVKYGIKRHKPKTPGSDGKLGNDFVEIKTISPEKKSQSVRVKLAGNFNKLLVVKITRDFAFESRMLARKKMPKSEGAQVNVQWSSIPSEPTNTIR
ncbi:DUF6998 domain-containing protein [Novipirellula maiorica]|nr:hypothetical protein [Rhodopirellula maiorica]